MATERDPDPRKQTEACAALMKKGLGVLRCKEIVVVEETAKGKVYDCPICGAHFASNG
jgi:hypothetical protein